VQQNIFVQQLLIALFAVFVVVIFIIQ